MLFGTRTLTPRLRCGRPLTSGCRSWTRSGSSRRLLAHPSERVLLDAMSWLPERVAGAARRRQPHVVAAYLEDLAGRYFDWQEACPVMRPGSVPPRPLGGELTQARLQLASAARTALQTGLQLLGIAAPGRM